MAGGCFRRTRGQEDERPGRWQARPAPPALHLALPPATPPRPPPRAIQSPPQAPTSSRCPGGLRLKVTSAPSTPGTGSYLKREMRSRYLWG